MTQKRSCFIIDLYLLLCVLFVIALVVILVHSCEKPPVTPTPTIVASTKTPTPTHAPPTETERPSPTLTLFPTETEQSSPTPTKPIPPTPTLTNSVTPVSTIVSTPDRWCWHPGFKIWIYNCYKWLDPNLRYYEDKK